MSTKSTKAYQQHLIEIPGSSTPYRAFQKKNQALPIPYSALPNEVKSRIKEAEWMEFISELVERRIYLMPTFLWLLVDDLCASPCCNLFVYNINSYELYAQQLSIQRYELLPGCCEEFCRSEQCLFREGCCLCMAIFNFFTCCYWEQFVGIRQHKAVLNATYDSISRFNKYLFRPRGIDVSNSVLDNQIANLISRVSAGSACPKI
jgi:hypothetical protein